VIVRNMFSKVKCVLSPSGLAPRVKKEFKKEVDINYIISRMKQGINPPAWMTSKTPRWGDFTDGPQSLMESFDLVERAHQAFESLPLAMRRELDHDFRNLGSAPRELYERFGLLKGPVGAPSATPKESASPAADPSPRASVGSNKGKPKVSPDSVDSEA